MCTSVIESSNFLGRLTTLLRIRLLLLLGGSRTSPSSLIQSEYTELADSLELVDPESRLSEQAVES